MMFSDDESETLTESVTNYHFVDDKDEPVSFSILPIQWRERDTLESSKKAVFLHGNADDGLQKIYKQVRAWKLELLHEEPEVSVLSKEKNWIKLLKPRKIFEDTTIRSILITIQCLHIVKKNQEIMGKLLWDQLQKIFSAYEVRPSKNDLVNHIPLIKAAIKHDEVLSKSKFLMSFVENPFKKSESDKDDHSGTDAKTTKFIVDDEDEDMGVVDDDESDEEDDLFDSVCCICDNGGELLWTYVIGCFQNTIDPVHLIKKVSCEGRCMRSFHATLDDGAGSDCISLGLSKAQVEAIQNFLCKNCQLKQHQCFACGKLGSSDKSSGAEVFSCVSATCGFFYHPNCVAKLLHPTDELKAEDLQKKIRAGESFTCPAHKCHVCKERENKDVHDLHFAVCRRCPRAYHRKCMPRKIAFEDSEGEDVVTRAWEELLPNNRILIYCLKHKIEEDLETPLRNHIVFPGEEKNIRSVEQQSSKGKALAKRKFVVTEESLSEKGFKIAKNFDKISSNVKGSSLKKMEKPSSGTESDLYEKTKISDASRKPLKDGIKSATGKDKASVLDNNWLSVAEARLNSMLKKCPTPDKSKKQETSSNKVERPIAQSTMPALVDAETKKRILAMMEKTSSLITLEAVKKEHKVPSTHAHSSRSVVDKTITHGKVEGLVEAVRTALQRLEEGDSVEDAQAVCGPEVIKQIFKWKNKLRVYLGPFLHGMRYTSFGRHFTKVDKLKEIVDKLHSYVNDGDMVVDFCCGSNDFSWFMKEKLEESGKKCHFKNFDIILPKNDFSFEQRDWMTVSPHELPTGSNLIMGLNPPFGVQAALANKFINKALEFKPKLIILIVPPETQRLDKKKSPYDLVWEDSEKLSGKSFYLPGSVDAYDNQMEQWNVQASLLSLWSRSDWTAKHKVIAQKQGHVSTYNKEAQTAEIHDKAQLSDHPMDISPIHEYPRDANKYGEISSQMSNLPDRSSKVIVEEAEARTPRAQAKSSLTKHSHSGQQSGKGYDKSKDDHSKYGSNSNKKRARKNKKERQEKLKQFRKEALADKPLRMSSSNWTDPKHSVERQPSEGRRTSMQRAASEDGIRSLQSNVLGSDYRAGYGGSGMSIPSANMDEITKGYTMNVGNSFLAENGRWSTTDANHSQDYGIRGVDGYGQNPYSTLNEYRGEPDVRQIPHPYGGQGRDSASQTGHLLGQDIGYGRLGSLSSSYGLPDPGARSSFNGMTASARYAPRLDELNHTRMGALGFDPSQITGSGMYDPLGSQYTPGSSFYPNPSGYGPGLSRPF